MTYQVTVQDADASPFIPRNTHKRALLDASEYVNEAAPAKAQEWLELLAHDDDPDLEARDDDYDYIIMLMGNADEEEAMELAKLWVWDQIDILDTDPEQLDIP